MPEALISHMSTFAPVVGGLFILRPSATLRPDYHLRLQLGSVFARLGSVLSARLAQLCVAATKAAPNRTLKGPGSDIFAMAALPAQRWLVP
jgi:hypothetical protein